MFPLRLLHNSVIVDVSKPIGRGLFPGFATLEPGEEIPKEKSHPLSTAPWWTPSSHLKLKGASVSSVPWPIPMYIPFWLKNGLDECNCVGEARVRLECWHDCFSADFVLSILDVSLDASEFCVGIKNSLHTHGCD